MRKYGLIIIVTAAFRKGDDELREELAFIRGKITSFPPFVTKVKLIFSAISRNTQESTSKGISHSLRAIKSTKYSSAEGTITGKFAAMSRSNQVSKWN